MMARLSHLWRYAAITALLIVTGITTYYHGLHHSAHTMTDVLCIEAPIGSRTMLHLPDGTLVWLNTGSRLTYPPDFGSTDRYVQLEGEGYFEVQPNKKIPFLVKTNHLQVKVLGTKFAFRNYPTDQHALVSLLEGKVLVHNMMQSDTDTVLTPNKQAVLDKANGTLKVETMHKGAPLQWVDGYLLFDDEPLHCITNELERYYGVHIHIADDELRNICIHGGFRFEEQGIIQVLDALASTGKIKYQISEKQIIIYK